MKQTGERHPLPFLRIAALCLAAMLVFATPRAALAEDGVLSDSVWEHIFTADSVAGGLIQSICITDRYIITLENVADDPNAADVVSAYYNTEYDEYGNPVGRFTLANRVQMEEWEHCNGMCFNPVKNEIYVTLYTNTIEENRGCLYVMDPDTLMKKGRIKVTDDFNLLAITYDNANDRYFIQTNADADYRIMILNSDFQIVEDYGPEPADPGYNFQDFCLANGYLLQFPLTWNMGIGEYMMGYSIDSRSVEDTIQLFFDELPDEKYIEPESIGWLDERSFIVPVNATAYDDSRRCLFYHVTFPHLFPETSDDSTEPEQEEEKTRTNSEVSSTEVESIASVVNVTKGNQELARPAQEDTSGKKVPVVAIILLLLLAAFIVLAVLYIRHVRKERAKREARMRKKRRMMLAQLEKEMRDE